MAYSQAIRRALWIEPCIEPVKRASTEARAVPLGRALPHAGPLYHQLAERTNHAVRALLHRLTWRASERVMETAHLVSEKLALAARAGRWRVPTGKDTPLTIDKTVKVCYIDMEKETLCDNYRES